MENEFVKTPFRIFIAESTERYALTVENDIPSVGLTTTLWCLDTGLQMARFTSEKETSRYLLRMNLHAYGAMVSLQLERSLHSRLDIAPAIVSRNVKVETLQNITRDLIAEMVNYIQSNPSLRECLEILLSENATMMRMEKRFTVTEKIQ